jgi:hypothetical protein
MSASAQTTDNPLGPWLRQVLSFPLKPWLWPLIAAAALVTGLVTGSLPFLDPILSGLLALATTITLWVLALRVGTRLLLATADGAGLERDYRDVDLEEFQAQRQIALWFLVALVLAALYQSLGPIALGLGMIIAAALLPQMMLLVALDNRLGAVFDLARWRALRPQLSSRDRRRLSALVVALSLAYLALDGLAAWLLPIALANAAMMAVWVYGSWVVFYALGLGLKTGRQAREGAADAATAESIDELKARLSKEGISLPDYRRLIRALEQNGDREGLVEHGPGFVGALLLAHERAPEAVERAAALADIHGDFVLGVPSAQLALIKAAREYGCPDLVLRLVEAYLRAWPAAPGGREARLIACEVSAAKPGSAPRAWFRELVQDHPTDDERRRLRAIATRYVDTSARPS